MAMSKRNPRVNSGSIKRDYIIAERLGVTLSISEYVAPAAEAPVEAPVEVPTEGAKVAA